MTHFVPTLGREIKSFIRSTTYSIIVTQRDFLLLFDFIYFWTGIKIVSITTTATNQSIKTCLVTEKSIPNIFGK